MIPSNSTIVDVIKMAQESEPGKVVDAIKDTANVVTELIKLFTVTNNLKLRIAGRGVKILCGILRDFADIFDMSTDNTRMSKLTDPKVLESIKNVTEITRNLIEITNNIITLSFRFIIFFMLFPIFKSGMNKLVEAITIISDSLVGIIIGDEDIKTLENVHKAIVGLKSVSKGLIVLSLWLIGVIITSPLLDAGLNSLSKAFTKIEELIDNITIGKESAKAIEDVSLVVKALAKTATKIIWLALLSIPLIMCIPIAIVGVWMIIQFVKIVAKMINKVQILGRRAARNILKIAKIIASLLIIDAILIMFGLMTPFVIKYVLLGMLNVLTILLFLIVVAYLLKFVSRMISKFVFQIAVFTLLVIIIMGALLFATLCIYLISKMSEDIMENIKNVMLVIAATVAIAAAIAGLGYLAIFIAPGVIGILALTIALLCILVMVAVMRIIQEINLDQEAILDVVDTVFDTASQIIGRMFQSRKDPEEKKRDGDPKTSALEHGPMSSIWTVIKVLIGCVTLFLILVSVVIILLIATMLRILQILDLDENKILSNVDTVLGTAHHIMARIFDPEEKETKKTKKGFILSVLRWIGGPIADVVEAVLAVAYLAMIMLAIGIIMLIALMLRGLENFDLNEKKILRNIDMIISTCHRVIEAILYPDEEKTKSTKKGFIMTLLEWIGGPIAKIVEVILAVAYLAFIMLGIGCILLIANMLEKLQDIKLDDKKIMKNVDTVISTCHHVVESVLYPDEDKTKKSSKGFIMTILSWIGGPIAQLIEVIMAVAYLATSILAVGLIKCLAGQLAELQDMVLDADKITENVDIVISTCHHVVEATLYPDEDETKNSSKGFIRTILGWIGGPIADIIDVIMAVGYLATSMLAVGLIKSLAETLKIIQDIDLDANKVTENVDTVISTCHHIVEKVLHPNEDATKSSGKGFIRKLLKWIGGPIVDIIDVIMACAYLATSMMAVGLVSSLAQQLQIIADIEFDDKIIKSNTDKILDCAGHVVRGINRSASDFGNTSKRRGWLARMIRKIAPDLFSIIDSLSATAQVATASASIAIILKIGKLLSMIGEIEINTDLIKDNVTDIFDCIDHVKKLVDEKCAPRPELVEGNWFDRWKAARKQARSDRDQMQQMNKANAIIMKLATLANSLEQIQKINIDHELIKKRIDFIFGVVDSIQEYMNKKSEMKAAEMDKYIRKRRGWFGITWYEYTEEYYKKIAADKQAQGDLDKAAAIVNQLGEMAANMEKVQKVEIDQAMVITKIQFLFDTMEGITNYFQQRREALHMKAVLAAEVGRDSNYIYYNVDEYNKALDKYKIKDEDKESIDATAAIFTSLGTMADNLEKIMKIKVDSPKVKQNTDYIMECGETLMNKLIEKAEVESTFDPSQYVNNIITASDSVKQMSEKITEVSGLKVDKSKYNKVIDTVVSCTDYTAANFKFKTESTSFSPSEYADVIVSSSSLIKQMGEKIAEVAKLVIEKFKFIKVIDDIPVCVTHLINKFKTKPDTSFDLETSVIVMSKGESATKIITKKITEISKLIVPKAEFTRVMDDILACVDYTVTNFKAREEATLSQDSSICLNYMREINNELDRFKKFDTTVVSNTKQQVGNYITFLDKVQAMNPEKLKLSAGMFEQMARFSESVHGNFDRIADAVNEDLMPALKELKDLMEKLPKAVRDSGATISASISAASGIALSGADTFAQVKRENPNASNAELAQKSAQRAQAQAKSNANQITSKIDKLIGLFEKGKAKIELAK